MTTEHKHQGIRLAVQQLLRNPAAGRVGSSIRSMKRGGFGGGTPGYSSICRGRVGGRFSAPLYIVLSLSATCWAWQMGVFQCCCCRGGPKWCSSIQLQLQYLHAKPRNFNGALPLLNLGRHGDMQAHCTSGQAASRSRNSPRLARAPAARRSGRSWGCAAGTAPCRSTAGKPPCQPGSRCRCAAACR